VSSEIIFDHRSIFHDKPNALKLCDICDGIAGNGDDVGEFSGFDGTHAILPAKHSSLPAKLPANGSEIVRAE